MGQAKFSLRKGQLEFVNQYESWGFPDKSALVREALDEMRVRLARARLEESARLYAEVYADEAELQQLTEAAIEGWPQ